LVQSKARSPAKSPTAASQCLPSAAIEAVPVIRSAAGFHSRISPCAPVTMMASPTRARIASDFSFSAIACSYRFADSKARAASRAMSSAAAIASSLHEAASQ